MSIDPLKLTLAVICIAALFALDYIYARLSPGKARIFRLSVAGIYWKAVAVFMTFVPIAFAFH